MLWDCVPRRKDKSRACDNAAGWLCVCNGVCPLVITGCPLPEDAQMGNGHCSRARGQVLLWVAPAVPSVPEGHREEGPAVTKKGITRGLQDA